MRKKITPQPGAVCSPEDMHWLEDDGHFYELEGGILVQYPSSLRSNLVSGHVLNALHSHFEPPMLAWILSIGFGFQCFPWSPNTVRRPSVSFLSWERISLEDAMKEEHGKIPPELVAEVLIQGDLPGGIHRRVADWLEAGVKVVWVINPESKTLIAHHLGGPMIPYREQDTLTCEELFPGFAWPVADLFASPRRK